MKQAQTVYIPIDVKDELPPLGHESYFIEGVPPVPTMGGGVTKSVAKRLQIPGVMVPREFREQLSGNNGFNSSLMVTSWFKKQELICFTPEELGEFVSKIAGDAWDARLDELVEPAHLTKENYIAYLLKNGL